MRKLKLKMLLLTLLMSAGGVSSWAQTDVTNLLVNPSFEYSAEAVAYTSETKLSSSNNIYGWTLPELGSNLYDIQVTPKSSASTGDNTFGQSLPSDGAFYFYNRKGWSTVATSLTQTATLPAGKYFITVDYKAAEWSGYRTKLGFKVADQELINTFCAARFTATTTYFADVEWKTLGAWFTVEEEGAVKIEIIETLGGNDRRADICLDNVKLYKWDLNDETNYDNATKSNPMDVTAKFVTNPYFDNNKDGWTSTTGYQNNGRATNQAGAFSGGFYENWNGSAKTSGKMYQTLSGLPDGIFRVTAAAFVNNANANVYLFAGLQKTPVNSTTPSLYSVQTTVNGGSLEIGLALGDGNAANWIGLDNVKLEYLGFDIDAAIAGIQEQATAAQAHLSDKAYTGYITNLQNAINAINSLNSETATKASISTAAENLNNALAAVSNSVADYANLQTNINNAKAYSVVNLANASDYAAAISAAETIYADASAETTAAAILSMQNYKTLDYTYITTTYTENSALGTWTEDFAEDLNGEDYVADGAKYWNEWGTNTRTAKQTVTLPAGDYAVSAIGRGGIGTSGYLYYKLGDADPVTVDFLMKGNRGRGVETSGAANFAEEGTYNCNGEGFGWEYRFLTFTLAEETTVELGVSATFASNWVSIYAPQLFTTEATVKSVTQNFINNELTNNIPDGKMNSDVLSALNTKKAAAEKASMDNTKDELNTILEELRTAIANANASIAAYTLASEKLPLMKAIVDATNVYTAEALEAYYTTPKASYDDNSMTDEEANALVDPNATTGWRAESPAVSQFLISAWDSEINDWSGLHVNTWSAASDFGETGFAVPLMEYWSSGSLAAKTMTATVTGLEAGNYKVSADMFIKAAALPTGASLQVGEAAAATITGTQNGEFYVSNATAYGTVGNDGVLTIKLIVADGNNFSWIGFKNMKYEQVNVDYAELNAAISAANATNAKIAGGVQALTDAITDAQALLTSLVQDDIDAGVSTLNAAITAAETTIVARKNLAGVAKKAAALNAFLAESIETDITDASEYAANADATASEADSKAEALLANFASWQKVTLTNADFDTDPNILASSISESAALIYAEKGDPHAYEQTGWTSALTYGSNASFAKSSVYGSSMAVMNQVAAPVADMYGKNEGATLGLSSGWSNQARFNQDITSLPAGKYVIYYEAYNNYSTQTSIESNYFGVSGLTGGTVEGTANTWVFDDTKTFPYAQWTTAAKGFQLNKSQENAKMEIGIIGSTGSSNNAAKIWVDNVTLYLIEEYPIAEAADYAALNSAVEAAETKVTKATPLGFDEDEYAPYNVAALSEVITAAKGIDQEAENLKSTINTMKQTVEDATTALTANTEEVNAIYNSDMAIANGTNPKGWSRVGNGWGQHQTSGGKSVWYYNQNSTSQYGNTGLYTMPLKTNTVYELKLKYCSQENNTLSSLKVSVLNGSDEGLALTELGDNKTTTLDEKSIVFRTGTAGDYILSIANTGNFYFTDVVIKRAVAENVTIAENETFEPSLKYANVTLNRTIKADVWNTFCVPFDITNDELKAAFGDDVAVAEYSEEAKDENSTVSFNTMDTPAITANKPVLLKSSTEKTASDNIVFEGRLIKTGDAKVEGTNYDFVGTYAASTTIEEGDYYLSANKLYRSLGKGSYVLGTRAFIQSKNAEARIDRFFIDDEESQTTTVNTVKKDAEENATIYNLNGQKIDKQNLRKGLYIQNGHKVVKK